MTIMGAPVNRRGPALGPSQIELPVLWLNRLCKLISGTLMVNLTHPRWLYRTLLPPSAAGFVVGYPGIALEPPDRPQAAVIGTLELSTPRPVTAKWIHVELRKIESTSGIDPFSEIVGTSPIVVWSASPSDYALVESQTFNFMITIPDEVPPTVSLDNGSIRYELVATLCGKGKGRSLLRRERPPSLAVASTEVVILKHELHSTWPIYERREKRHVTENGMTLTIYGDRTCLGRAGQLTIRAILQAEGGARPSSFELTLLRKFRFLSNSGHFGRKEVHLPSPQCSVVMTQDQPITATYFQVIHPLEMTCVLPPAHTAMTVTTARLFENTYEVQVKALISNGDSISVSMPITVSPFTSDESKVMLKHIGELPLALDPLSQNRGEYAQALSKALSKAPPTNLYRMASDPFAAALFTQEDIDLFGGPSVESPPTHGQWAMPLHEDKKRGARIKPPRDGSGTLFDSPRNSESAASGATTAGSSSAATAVGRPSSAEAGAKHPLALPPTPYDESDGLFVFPVDQSYIAEETIDHVYGLPYIAEGQGYFFPEEEGGRLGQGCPSETPDIPTAAELAIHDTARHATETAPFTGTDVDSVESEIAHVGGSMDMAAPDLAGQVIKSGRRAIFTGTYSNVYSGVYANRKVAIKVLRMVKNDQTTERKFRRELSVWWRLRHPNVLPLYGYYGHDDGTDVSHALVSEWADRGNAANYIRLDLSWNQRIGLLHDVSKGLKYLHEFDPPIVHADLKPLNVLIDKDGVAQLCDFGLARFMADGLETGMTTTTAHTGTIRYLSHELVEYTDRAIPTTASDIYALGCLGLEFIYQILPHAALGMNQAKILRAIGDGVAPAKRHIDSDEIVAFVWDLLEACWSIYPDERPTSQSICQYLDHNTQALSDALALAHGNQPSGNSSQATLTRREDVSR